MAPFDELYFSTQTVKYKKPRWWYISVFYINIL